MFSWSFPGIAPLRRIGKLRWRLAVSDHGLQAWESRYALLQPARHHTSLGSGHGPADGIRWPSSPAAVL